MIFLIIEFALNSTRTYMRRKCESLHSKFLSWNLPQFIYLTDSDKENFAERVMNKYQK